jgi:glycosyltransferase involved in cell wall biosynthesis
MDIVKPCKVFHILSNPGIGGIEGMLSELIPKVDKAVFDMQIVNMRSESEAYQLWDRTNVPYYRLGTPGKLLLGSILELVKLLRKESPNVVQIYGLRANIIGRLAAKITSVPLILTGVVSTDDWRKWYHVWLDRATGWTVNGWIANSQACKKSLVEREKYRPERISVIYDGIDISYWTKDNKSPVRKKLRKQWGNSDDDIVFVTVANLRPDKGVQFLIEAIPTVFHKQPKARFVLVGSDWMGGRLQARCKQLGIENIVIFAGFRRDIRDIYHAADITILPSLREGLPICLIEAMSMELPVIATSVGGTLELVQNGQTGILIEAGNVDAICKAVIEMAADTQKRRQMGMIGRQRVTKMFSIDRMIKQLLNFYENIYYEKTKNHKK